MDGGYRQPIHEENYGSLIFLWCDSGPGIPPTIDLFRKVGTRTTNREPIREVMVCMLQVLYQKYNKCKYNYKCICNFDNNKCKCKCKTILLRFFLTKGFCICNCICSCQKCKYICKCKCKLFHLQLHLHLSYF